jgi:hypothetical protein
MIMPTRCFPPCCGLYRQLNKVDQPSRPDLAAERLTLPERMTGIELALSAWESDRSGSVSALTWAEGTPSVTVMDTRVPGLMASQWPG